jgi:CheY-like chemotaxis protein
MNKQIIVRAEFVYRSSDPKHQAALRRVREALLSSQVDFELREKDIADSAEEAGSLMAIPCLRRIEPKPVRTLIGGFERSEGILIALGLSTERAQQSGGARGGQEPSDSSSKKRFFVYAEDDDNLLLLVKTALRRLNAEELLVSCSDGQALLDLLQAAVARGNVPAFVLLDVNMPKVGGLEALERIKSNPLLSALPVIMFSSETDQRDIELARELGALDWRKKPHSFSELCAELKALLERFELQGA